MADFSNPASQPIYPPAVYFPPEYAHQLAFITTELRDAAVANERLQHQLSQQQFREKAYSEVFESGNECTYTHGRNGVPQMLMNTVIRAAYRLIPQPPLCGDPLYLIELSEHGHITMPECNFLSDSQLINSIQQLGIEVRILRTPKNTATLLRSSINRHLQHGQLLFYAGWWPSGDGSFNYWTFPGFRSCQSVSQPNSASKLPNQSEAVIVTAANQFAPAFNAIRTPILRQLVILLYHEAALHTLLRQLGYEFPLALCLFSTDESILTYFRTLLSWFAEPPIALDKSPNDFSFALLSRKDQPLLVEDRGRLSHAAKNIAVLETALLDGVAPWKDGRDIKSLPIQAPIILLSSRPSSLSCAPEVMVVDFIPDNFDRQIWQELELTNRIGQNQDYLTAFCSYTATHIPDLRSALTEGHTTALRLDDRQLSEPCRKALGILIGLQAFLGSFFRFADLTSAPSEPAEELSSYLLNLLVQTTEKADRTSLADQFVAVARQYIQNGILRTYHQATCPPDISNIVIYNDSCLFFPSKSLFSICQALSQSRPTILAALAEAGLFCGPKMNATTAQTRISIWSEHGIRTTAAVYALDREAFDILGDPLILESEVPPQ